LQDEPCLKNYKHNSKCYWQENAVIHVPRFTENESKYVQELIVPTLLPSVGKFVDYFEKGYFRNISRVGLY